MKKLSDRFMYYSGILASVYPAAVQDLKRVMNLLEAEEKGLLVKLPCKVGDIVWCLEEDEYAGYVFIAMSGEYYIVSASYVNCGDIYEQLEEMEEDTEN